MPTITWNATAKVGDEEIALTQKVDVDGYDVIEVTVAKEDQAKVSLQPSPIEEVRVLAVTGSRYSSNIGYEWSVDGTDKNVQAMTLDAPLFLAGGNVGLLKNATQVTFHNQAKENDVTVTLFVGRTAIVKESSAGAQPGNQPKDKAKTAPEK